MMLRVIAAAAACLAVAVPCVAQPPAPAPQPGRLPTGHLQLIGATPEVAQFFVGDLPKKTGDVVEVWMFYVQDPGVQVQGKKMTQVLQQKRIDCAAKTAADLYTGGWDGGGRRVTEAPAAPPMAIPEGTPLERVSNIACENAKPPKMTRVLGNRAAFTLGQQAIRTARTKAAAN
jgi:hypothetical protein